MKNRSIAASLVAASLLYLSACGVDDQIDTATRQAEEAAAEASAEADQIKHEIEEITDPLTEPGEQSDGAGGQEWLHDAAALQEALAALADAVGEEDPQLTELIVSADFVELMATDPQARDELNSWTYRDGSVGRFSPVDYGGDPKALRANAYSMSDLRPEAIVKFAESAVAESGVEGGELINIIVQRMLPFEDDIRMLANITGERDSKQVRADVNGKILEVL